MNSPLLEKKYDAVLFDLDGVLTPTAEVHAACWERLFNDFLRQYSKDKGIPYEPFDIQSDYRRYVDGKPRYEGVESFLTARNIRLPYQEDSAESKTTVRSLGDRKDNYFEEMLAADGIAAYEGAIKLVRYLRNQGIKTAVVSSSRNCNKVLKAANITDLFDAVMDGRVAEQLHLAGKPEPDTFLKAADQLGVEASRSVVVEDAIAGVQAGRNGNFGLVIGVAQSENASSLTENGADIVVSDLGRLLPPSPQT
ncbi:haloacid dehalogenase-like hydrolase, putative [Synechococcus sp. PCC 7335]|uniref:HAD family hydrolase n=1 Tax=Synechococcus sp. (strain ATCC 29403 / PCC 7335) TaxID=91464 RepID=UPI00017EC808|nr:beta-phosphoglucomutase family hydrolase [Synechococcus sp. PCC 7335]EDX83073.1 haloacid dehalogenase-like hydrolase, putative [Synechococcus sp. PCC 7335]